MSLGADDGDDDEMASYYLLYVTERLRKEISSLVMVNPEFLQDNYKIMKNVSAITSFTDKLKNFLMQLGEDSGSVMLGGEAAVFERATKSADKGDSKLGDRLDKLLDAVGAGRPIEEMYENLTRKG
ncbi:MAG TPA: hypothetical protein PLW93_06430 [Candidatus Absconditabacterales bacterium]|nr:hypothetical protein [Candidatus Absconditabacterales bacterium]